MVTTKDLMRASVVGEELIEEGFELGVEKGIEKGIEQGVERGRQEGRLEAIHRIRRHVRSLLASRISGEVDSTWLDSMDDIDQLDRLFDELLAARDETQARAAFDRARIGQ